MLILECLNPEKWLKIKVFLMGPYFMIKALYRDMQCLFVGKVKIIVEICSLIRYNGCKISYGRIFFMKKIIFTLMLLFSLLCGCISKEDRTAAQFVINEIDTIDIVTLEIANDIYRIQTKYNELSESQKKMVKNYDKFLSIKSQLEELVLEQELRNNPTNNIIESELIGVWKENGSTEVHKGFFYFTKEGYVYYMGSKGTPTQSSFTNEYLLSTQYSLGEYNNDKKAKEGNFYCIPSNKDVTFFITKSESGELKLEVIDDISGGIYYKSGEKIKLSPEKCLHDGCLEMAVEIGDSRYCKNHSNKCFICNKYIDEDALMCLNCIVEALKDN